MTGARELGARALRSHPHLFVVAAAAAGLACTGAPLALVIVAALLVAALAAFGAERAVAIVLGVALIAGFGLGTARVAAIDDRAGRVQPGDRVEGTAVVLERPRPSRFGSSAVLELRNGARVLARASQDLRWPEGGAPGTIVALAGTARAPRRAAHSDFDWPKYLRGRGIRSEVALEHIDATGRRRGGLEGVIDSMRRRAEAALSGGLSPPRAALARGMVLGQDESIPESTRDEFRASGLAHVLAVSGQNIMLLAALALPLLVVVGAGPRARALTVLFLIALYVPLAGAGPSLQRAGVTGAAGAIALAAGRTSSRWYAFGVAAVATLALNPRATGDPGWQLSFAAVAGILLLGPHLRAALGMLPRLVADGLAITLAATVSTAPLLAHHFGTVSVSGLAANVLALPVVAPIMWLGMAGAAIAQVPAVVPALEPVTAVVLNALAYVNGLLIGLLAAIARLFAEAPGSTAAVPLRSPVAVLAAYAVIAALAVYLVRAARRAEPILTPAIEAWRRSPRRTRALALAGAGTACALALAAWTSTPPPPEQLTVSFLDVGQGDATLVQAPGGVAVLFDGGPPEGGVAAQLKHAGVRELALVVMTHQSRDHHAGLQAVVERFGVDTLVENGDGTRDGSFWRVVETARRKGARIVRGGAGQRFGVGGLVVRVIGPPPRPPGPPPEDPNPRALATVVSYGDFDLFLSGDAESEALSAYPLPDVEAMKVSHHGSNDPGLPALLKRLRPQVAAIEVGEGNSYGHPTPATLAALNAAVPHVHRTDDDGTIELTVRGGAMAIDTDR